jgi:hypothetical protein
MEVEKMSNFKNLRGGPEKAAQYLATARAIIDARVLVKALEVLNTAETAMSTHTLTSHIVRVGATQEVRAGVMNSLFRLEKKGALAGYVTLVTGTGPVGQPCQWRYWGKAPLPTEEIEKRRSVILARMEGRIAKTYEAIDNIQ